jgi:hypothetical protein
MVTSAMFVGGASRFDIEAHVYPVAGVTVVYVSRTVPEGGGVARTNLVMKVRVVPTGSLLPPAGSFGQAG